MKFANRSFFCGSHGPSENGMSSDFSGINFSDNSKGIYNLTTPLKFNTSPLKSYLPKRKPDRLANIMAFSGELFVSTSGE